jgi:hypothetical protein
MQFDASDGHIHHFVGQYSFMAICAIFGLIVSETATFALHQASVVRPVVFDLLKKRRGEEHNDHSMDLKQAKWAVGHILVAVVVVFVSSAMIWLYLKNTYGLIKQTSELSRTVEAKYNEAVQKICQQHSEITLADLQVASKDWGFDWRPQLIAETNRMPKCSG